MAKDYDGQQMPPGTDAESDLPMNRSVNDGGYGVPRSLRERGYVSSEPDQVELHDPNPQRTLSRKNGFLTRPRGSFER